MAYNRFLRVRAEREEPNMLQEFLVVGGSVLTLFLLMSVGFGFGRAGLLSPDRSEERRVGKECAA